MTAGTLTQQSKVAMRNTARRAGCGRLGLDPTKSFVSPRRVAAQRSSRLSERHSGALKPQVRIRRIDGRLVAVDAKLKSEILRRYLSGILTSDVVSIRRAVRDLSPDIRFASSPARYSSDAIRTTVSTDQYAGKWVALGPHGVVAAERRLADLLEELEKRSITGVTTEYIEPAFESIRIGSG